MSEPAAKKEERRKFQAIRGVRDLLPPETELWNRVEQTAREVFGTFGFGEIRLPIFEPTELFARSIGTDTDVVSKQMYAFEDYETSPAVELRTAIVTWEVPPGGTQTFEPFISLAAQFASRVALEFNERRIPATPENRRAIEDISNQRQILQSVYLQGPKESVPIVALIKERARQVRFGDDLALRPEATASVCRAYVEHGMQSLPQPVKLYYMGAMFRRERPQKGRYRQFYQIGAEVLGGPGSPSVDAEIIEIVMTFFRKLGLLDAKLEINSIGDQACRPEYVKALQQALIQKKESFGLDSQRRIETNPLRVLDSKLPSEQEVIESLPHITDYLCSECQKNYEDVKHELRIRDIPFRENWRLVRGLDYYVRTTFEVTASGLGAQNAICGGGRYDGLIEILGGPKNTRGVGFAIGEDRLMDALEQRQIESSATSNMDVMVTGTSDSTWEQATRLASSLRKQGLRVYLPNTGTPLGKAMEAANRERIRVAVIVGDSEFSARKYAIRILRPFTEQGAKNWEVDADKIELYGRLVKLRNDLERKLLGLLGESPALFKGHALSKLVQELNRRNLIPTQYVDDLMNLIPNLNSSIHGDWQTESTSEWALVVGNTILVELDRLSEPLDESV